MLSRAHVLAGLMPMRSFKAAQMIAQVPGVKVPKALLDRMESATNPKGVQITLELIDKLKRLPGVHGLHIMAVGWESVVPRLVKSVSVR